MIRSVFILLCALSLGFPVHAVQAGDLRDHEGVSEGLVIAGMVTEIEETCPSIGVRKVRGLLYLRSLYNLAQSAGFTHEEIETYVDDKDEEARLRKRVDAWLAHEGAETGNTESYCAVGRDHMDRGTQIGVLLKAE